MPSRFPSLAAALATLTLVSRWVGLPAWGQVSCGDWNTEGFFKAATVDDVTRCLDAGANANAKLNEWTPLHVAAANSESPAVIEALINAGANINQRKDGFTPLHSAAYLGTPSVVRALLKGGADPDIIDLHGKSAWRWAKSNPRMAGSILLSDDYDTNHLLPTKIGINCEFKVSRSLNNMREMSCDDYYIP